MKWKVAIFLMMIGILIPKQSFAMLDFLDSVIKVGEQAEGAITKVEGIYEEVEKKLQEFTSKFDNVKKLRDKAKEYQKKVKDFNDTRKMIENGEYMAFYNKHLSTLQVPGTNKAATGGDTASPELEQQVALSYFSRTNQANDVQVAKAHKTNVNRQLVKNFSRSYANALAKRLEIQEHLKTVQEEMQNEKDNKSKDLPELQEKYRKLMGEVDHRWQDIMLFEANNIAFILEVAEANKRVDDISEVLGVDEATAQKSLQNMGGDLSKQLQQPNGATVGDYVNFVSDKVNQGENLYNKVKSGDYRGAYNSASDAKNTVDDYYKKWKEKQAAKKAAENGGEGGGGDADNGGETQ